MTNIIDVGFSVPSTLTIKKLDLKSGSPTADFVGPVILQNELTIDFANFDEGSTIDVQSDSKSNSNEKKCHHC